MFPFRRKPGGDYLVFLGRMSPDKGAHRALAVALEMELPLKIAAKCREPLEIRYFDEFIRPHLGGSIEYVGEVGHADKVELLMGARALISPIDWEEPFGLMMIEAMACGTPVISTRRGAVPEIVEHGRTGVIVDNYRDMEDPERARARRLARSRRDPEGSRGAILAREHGGELRRRVRGDDRSIAHGVRLRSPYDREIVSLALPALGALAAEPLYVLVDTAIVGHLGRPAAGRARRRVHGPRRRRSRCSTSSSTGRPRRSPARAGPGRRRPRGGSARRRSGSRSRSASRVLVAMVAALARARRRDLFGGEGQDGRLRGDLSADRALGLPRGLPRDRAARASSAASPTCARRS